MTRWCNGKAFGLAIRAVASGVLGGAEHPRAAGAAPVLRMARSTPS